MFNLFNFLISLILLALDYAFGSFSKGLSIGVISGLYTLAVFLPGLAVTIRRLHDVGKSGWFIFIALIPLVGAIWLLVLLFTESESGENEYGPSPKGGATEVKNSYNMKAGTIKTVRVNPVNANVNLPFSRSDSENSGDNSSYRSSSEDKKTRIGRQPDMPSSLNSDNRNLACPKCQYPLRIEPSVSSPCPNCGFSGEAQIHETVSDSRKTILLNQLSLKDEEKLSDFKFKLIHESTGSEFKIESEEDEIVLNRDHLDPGNTSISSKEHVLVKFREGRVIAQDVSTNGSTFIQVTRKTPIISGTRIVMGNRVYLFTSGGQKQNAGDSKATRQLSNVSFENDNTKEAILTEEGTGRKVVLTQGVNLLNRSNLDPGNASISGSRHAEMEFTDGQWFISDLSSNAATFIQCKTEQVLNNKVRIIVGNIIFRFEYE